MDELTIEQYLRGFVSYDVPDNAMRSILYKMNVAVGASVDCLTERERDLCLAWLYLWCATTPSVKNSSEDSDGNWKHTEGGWQTSAYDKRQLRAMAQDLFNKWDEKITSNTKITIINI